MDFLQSQAKYRDNERHRRRILLQRGVRSARPGLAGEVPAGLRLDDGTLRPAAVASRFRELRADAFRFDHRPEPLANIETVAINGPG